MQTNCHQLVYANNVFYFCKQDPKFVYCISRYSRMTDPDCMYRQIARKADFTQEFNLFISTKHPHLPPTPFVKPCDGLK